MALEFERPQVTEIHVRMDCNGCVQKIKKAVNAINGIYDLYIDFPQQKVTVVGRADPERIMKAIKKVRKVATLCSHTDVPDANFQPTEPVQDEGAQPPDGPGQVEALEGPFAPQETVTDQNPQPYQPDNSSSHGPHQEWNPPATHAPAYMQPNQSHDYGHRNGYGNGYTPEYISHPGNGYRQEQPRQHAYHEPPHESSYHEQHRPVYNDPQPGRDAFHEPSPPPRAHYQEQQPESIYATQSYNMYRPAPSSIEYYYAHSPPRYTPQNRTYYYDMDSYQHENAEEEDDSSEFTDENPNACRIT